MSGKGGGPLGLMATFQRRANQPATPAAQPQPAMNVPVPEALASYASMLQSFAPRVAPNGYNGSVQALNGAPAEFEAMKRSFQTDPYIGGKSYLNNAAMGPGLAQLPPPMMQSMPAMAPMGLGQMPMNAAAVPPAMQARPANPLIRGAPRGGRMAPRALRRR